MDNLTTEELQRAAERVREMQRRADTARGTHSKPPEQHKPKENKPTVRRKSILDIINFKNMEMDSDISLLLGILLLLSSDSTDEILTLALIYIML